MTYHAYIDWNSTGIDVLVAGGASGAINGPCTSPVPLYVGDSLGTPPLATLQRLAFIACLDAGFSVVGEWRPYRNGLLTAEAALVGEAVGRRIADSLRAVSA